MKKLLIICAVVFVLGVSSPAQARPDGPTIWAEVQPGVWWGFSSIQTAIDNVMDGGYIWVENGTYTEAISIGDSNSFVLDGETESGVVVQAAASQTGDDNVFTIDAEGCDITIGYMTIRHGDYGIRSSAGNVNVVHCTLYHNGWNGDGLPDPEVNEPNDFKDFWSTYATNGGAMRIQNSASSEIAYCTVYENDRGIRFQDGNNGDIHNNNSHNNLESGIYLAASSYNGDTGCTNTEVYDNNSYGNMNNGILSIGGKNNTIRNNNVYDNWNSGVMLWHVAENTIQDNTINNNNLYAFNGEGKSGDAYGGVYAEGSDIAGGASFVFKLLGNTISNSQAGAAGQAIGLRLDETLPANGIEVSGNTFTNHDVDIQVRSQAGTTSVNQNKFDGADFGVQNDDTSATLDATYNWWNDPTGPYHEPTNTSGLGDAVSDGVYYSPWWECPEMNDCPRWNEPVVNIDSNSAYYYIQAAIDDANSGDTIVAKAGMYQEDLVVNKANLTIRSEAGVAVTTIKGIDIEPWANWPLANPNIEILASGVAITGFAIESPDVPDGNYSSGIVLDGTDVEIYDNNFVSVGAGDSGCVAIQTYRDDVLGYSSDISGLNIHDNDFGGTLSGGYVGVFINHTLMGSGTVVVQDNVFTGTPYQGVVTERSNTTISGNWIETSLDYTGYGVIVMDWSQREQNNVQVIGNIIRPADANGFAKAILIGHSSQDQPLSNINVAHNTLYGSKIGVLVRSSADGVAVNYNNIADNNSVGVENTDANNTLAAQYNWWGDFSGPSGQGSGSGDAVSEYVDYEPWLTKPFCYVGQGQPCEDDPSADLDGDGDVDWHDFALFASRWLEGFE
ncbi:MAG: right-handed parallel beta-helix repeat-containing protein [Planctomycetota bacterium]|jgi:parallel beta-helix repeat protein